MLPSIAFVVIAPLAARALPQEVRTRSGPGVPKGPFQLYAYGQGLGGLPVFNWDGMAYLGDPSLANDPEAAEVIFTQSGTDSTSMIASPKTSAGQQTPSWSNATYFLPSDTAIAHQTGFASGQTTASEVTSGFVFYGAMAAWAGSDGNIRTKWYATPYKDTNAWLLNWDSSSDSSESKIFVALRTTAPT